ncbi:MAG: squalene/phytoene synthase family protein [Pseudomonadota bacterium]|nr:squalene/phytoene synthase family protein [Pseudomonadota bacterium]
MSSEVETRPSTSLGTNGVGDAMRDRDLVRLYWPVELRAAFDALFALDDALGEVVATSSQPALGAIRLAWWRDALERLDTSPPPAEPRLQACAADILSRGVSGSDLANISEGWAALFEEVRDPEAIGARGVALFAVGAKLLGAEHGELGQAGAWFALADVARRGLAPPMLVQIRPLLFPPALRPLTGLARLAVRDLRHGEPFEPEGTPFRAGALLAHRWTGRIG